MTDVRHYGVFDLMGTGRYYYYASSGKEDVTLERSIPLRKTLISPEDVNSNKADYLVSEKGFPLEDIVRYDRYGTPDFDDSCIFPLEYMLMGLEIPLYRRPGHRFSAEGHFYQSDDKGINFAEKLSSWFNYQNVLLADGHDLPESDGFRNHPDRIIVTVPDNVSFDYQETLLNAVRSMGKCTLLWRSVAAAIGAEHLFKKYNVKDGDIIAICERTSIDIRVTKLKIHELDGRLIPGHRLYKTSDSEQRVLEWYPKETYFESYDRIPFLPFRFDLKGFLVPYEKDANKKYSVDLSCCNDSKFVLMIGSDMVHHGERCPVIIDERGEFVNTGAGRFANRMRNKIISYYDECESLSLVVMDKENEKVVWKPLIPASEKLTGGLVVREDPVSGVSYNPQTSSLEFYLRLGKQDPDYPLKVLVQDIKLREHQDDEQPFELLTRSIPLTLRPSMVAGQGRAKVLVTAADPGDFKYFKPVELNWAMMKDALSDDGKKITRNYLEANMDRSFPVTVPYPICDREKLRYAVYAMRDYINGNRPLARLQLNQPTRPFKDKNSIEKFIKVNVMGADWNEVAYQSDVDIINQFLHTINGIAMSDYHPEQTDALRHIGWTYDRTGIFDALVRRTVKQAEAAAFNQSSFMIQKMTILANLITDNELLVRFFLAFKARLGKLEALTNWLKGMSQILSYDVGFFDTDKIKHSDVNYCVRRLNQYFFSDSGSGPQKRLYTIQTLIFLLKYRSVYHGFAKNTSDDPDDVFTYELIDEIVQAGKDMHGTKNFHNNVEMLKKFLDGKGNLELPELDEG